MNLERVTKQRDELHRQAESMVSDFNMIEHDRDEWKARYEFSVTVRDSLQQQRDELLATLKDACEKMRKCDYVQARSDMLAVVAKVEG